MDRRKFLKAFAATSLIPSALRQTAAGSIARPLHLHRVRPGDEGWPSNENWQQLNAQVGGRLIKVEWPLARCSAAPGGEECAKILKQLKNPYYIGDQPGLTQTSGWVDAWTSTPSVYAVAAQHTKHVVSAVNFARQNNLRLVIKGGGHSYQGTSNGADSLLIWTRALNDIVLHGAFVGKGCEGKSFLQPAVSIGAGSIWMHTYGEVVTKGGRYVQGGGCATVGVAGLIQSGGFGSFSKYYGLAAAGLIEAEVVTADGSVRVANGCTNPDLFWAVKGGGGGSFGVITRLTLRTRDLPEFFGGVIFSVTASSDVAYRKLLEKLVTFYKEKLFNPHWGEQIVFGPQNKVRVQMLFAGLSETQARTTWRTFLDWVSSSPDDFTVNQPILFKAIPARSFWDPQFWKKNAPEFVVSDERPGAPERNIFWVGDRGEAGQFLHAYKSAWLPSSLLHDTVQQRLVHALFESSRHRCVLALQQRACRRSS